MSAPTEILVTAGHGDAKTKSSLDKTSVRVLEAQDSFPLSEVEPPIALTTLVSVSDWMDCL